MRNLDVKTMSIPSGILKDVKKDFRFDLIFTSNFPKIGETHLMTYKCYFVLTKKQQ